MSCGCGCCPKCGCRATCTCNNSLDWTLESRSDFSYIDSEPVKMNTVVGGDDQDRCNSSSSFNGDEEFSRGPSDAQGPSRAHAKKGSRGVNNNWEAHYNGAY